MIQQKDPYTGEIFYAKRSNQRFANRENQVAYNNAKAKELRDQMAEVDIQIKRNWQILSDVLENADKLIQSKDYLLGCGYNFNFFNNIRESEGNQYFGVYDYGLRLIEIGKYELIKFNRDE
ncbi:hypothetical protein ERX46_05440 [Brumimicrobium glaciale]|uniref:Uncharacterized protein n=1 Tax=Brumimicrobium glaciale TaxID=200475 RepID=A0A4Q4KS17_9FLAO|nr:hypothetical protein [Brumimicrobium glaciale]RYM34819.1 hypothetical protein ERX46_05440 [Brumimicrobium glaciale]